jgi:hypothetical protein
MIQPSTLWLKALLMRVSAAAGKHVVAEPRARFDPVGVKDGGELAVLQRDRRDLVRRQDRPRPRGPALEMDRRGRPPAAGPASGRAVAVKFCPAVLALAPFDANQIILTGLDVARIRGGVVQLG